MLSDWEKMLNEAEWSDKFFNYVPAEQAYSINLIEHEELQRQALEDVAVMFLEVNPDCPYDKLYLAKDFLRRI